jgi:hypothetical protein
MPDKSMPVSLHMSNVVLEGGEEYGSGNPVEVKS